MSTGVCHHRYASVVNSHSPLCSLGVLPMVCPDCNTNFLKVEWRLFLRKSAPLIAAVLWLVVCAGLMWRR